MTNSSSGGSEEEAFQAAASYDGDEKFAIYTHTFTDRSGLCECVSTTDEDEVFWVYREGRRGPSRFVRNKPGEVTNQLTVILALKGDCYVIITAFWGPPAAPEVWDERAFLKDPRGYDIAKQESIDFWKSHALIIL